MVAREKTSSLIVTDAGPLIAISVTKLLPLVVETFGHLTAPQAVVDECIGDPSAPGAKAIRAGIRKGLLSVVPTVQLLPLDEAYALGLGGGEIAVLAYAKQHKLIALIDDRRARRVAKQLSVVTIGSGAILIELKRQNLLESVKPVLQAWREHGYYLSEKVIADILVAAKE